MVSKPYRFHKTNPAGSNFFENRQYKGEIPPGQDLWKVTGKNKTFGAGVSAGGLSLSTQSGYNKTTKHRDVDGLQAV